MEIKVGEYVRTENGKIHKVEDTEDLRIHIKTEKPMFRSWVEDYYGCHKEDNFIVKHSRKIIDLIEVGDYVNGCKVYENHTSYLTVYQKVKNSEVDYNFINWDEIKTILTHEQFEQNCYRLEGIDG